MSSLVQIRSQENEVSPRPKHPEYFAIDRRRVGVAFFYMPAHARSIIGRRTATLVRGKDSHGHWDAEPMPKLDLDPVCMEFLRNSWARYRDPDVPQAAKLKAS